MAEDWDAIAIEIAEAIGSVGFTATLTRPSGESDEPQNPWDPPASPVNPPIPYTVTVIDDGIKTIHVFASQLTRQARVLTIAAGVVIPQHGDTITVRGLTHQIISVNPLAPGGVDLLYDVELGA